MLRYQKSPHQAPHIIPFKITYTGGVPALSLASNVATVADTGTGIATITLKQPFVGANFIGGVATAGTKGYSAQVQITNSSTVVVRTFNTSKAAADSDSYVLLFGQLAGVDNLAFPASILTSKSKKGRLVPIVVESDAITVGKTYATLTKGETGEYAFVVKSGGKKSSIPVVTPIYDGVSIRHASAVSVTNTGFKVWVYNDSTAIDGDFCVLVYVEDDRDGQRKATRAPVFTPQIQSYLDLAVFSHNGSAFTKKMGKQQYAFAYDAAGSYTLTPQKLALHPVGSKRSCVVIAGASAATHRRVEVGRSTTAASVYVQNSSDALVDNDVVSALIVSLGDKADL